MSQPEMSRWGCECGAIWTSVTGGPPRDRMCSPTCPKPSLQKLTPQESASEISPTADQKKGQVKDDASS